jgi:serine protease Do
MRQQLSKIPGLAILALFIQTSAFSQQESGRDKDEDGPRKYDEIIIRHRAGKDAKVTIEIKDGDFLVNGKPVSEYEDSTLSVHRRKVTHYGNSFTYVSPDMAPMARIQGFPNSSGTGWSFSDDNAFKSNRAMLGVVTEASAKGKGVKITQLTKGGAAGKMGLQLGDILTKIDEEEIDGPRELSKVIGGHDAGDKVTITYLRDGKEQKVTGELGKARDLTVEPMNMYKFEMPDMKEFQQGEWPKDLREFMGNGPKFGIRAQDGEDGKGVKVLDVDDESTAAKAGIKEGDIITRFDGKEINSVTQLSEAAHVAKEKISVKVSLLRDGKAQEVDVRVPRRLRTADL